MEYPVHMQKKTLNASWFFPTWWVRWQVEYNSRKSKEVKGNTEQPRTKITIIKKKDDASQAVPNSNLFSVEHHHGSPHSSINIFPINHREWKNPFHFLPQHLIPGKSTPAPQNPPHSCLHQALHWQHGTEVFNDATAHSSGYVAQGELRGSNTGDWSQLVRNVSLSK